MRSYALLFVVTLIFVVGIWLTNDDQPVISGRMPIPTEFNEKKSFNCQAYSAAFYVSLVKNKKMSLNKIQSPIDFKSIAPKKFIKNYQPQLL